MKCMIIRIKDSFALIDAEDWDKIKNFTWGLSDGYAQNSHRSFGMHNRIMDYYGPLDIDHINRDPLDNRKINLRIVSRNINNLNRVMIDGTKIRYLATGTVVYDARIQFENKSIHLGTYKTKRRAQVFVEAARKRLIEGQRTVFALKRKHRWAPLERKELSL